MSLDDLDVATMVSFDAAGRMRSLATGATGPTQLMETYTYDASSPWLVGQQLHRGTTRLMDLEYSYEPSTQGLSGRTGQLTHCIDHLDDKKTSPSPTTGWGGSRKRREGRNLTRCGVRSTPMTRTATEPP